MAALIPAFFVLVIAYAQYRNAKADGQWSWPGFFLVLGSMGLFFTGYLLPIINSKILQIHPGWMMTLIFGGILLYVSGLIYTCRRYYASKGYVFGKSRPAAAAPAASPNRDQSAALVLLVLCFAAVAHAQSPKVYLDPSGVYSVAIPSGWEAEPQQGSPMVSLVDTRTKVSVTLGIMRGPETNTPTAESQLKGIEDQFPKNCPQARIQERGQAKIAGIPGAFLLVHCAGDDGPQLMKVSAATRPGLVAMMITNSPGNAYLKDTIAIESINNSLKVLSASAGSSQTPRRADTDDNGQPSADQSAMQGSADGQSSGQPSSSAGTYKDPEGRYSLAVPPGWNTASDNGNLTLSSGASFVTVTTSNGSQPSEVNHQIVQQIQAQYKEFKILNDGDFQNNGTPAHGTNATGINPKGVRASVLVVSISAGSGHYLVLISSAPNAEAQQINSTVMQIAQSVHFGS